MEGKNRLGSKRILARLGKVEVITMILALIAEMILFSLLSPHFFTVSNLLTIVQYCALVGIVALPFSILGISGSMDLSLGSTVAFTSMIVAITFKDMGGTTTALLVAILVGIAAGAAVGAINGFFIAKMKLAPFIATLTSMNYLRGIAYLLRNGQPVAVMEKSFGVVGRGRTFGLPNTLYIYLVLIVVFWFIAKYTVFGRRSYMVGGNQDAARLMGINVEKHLIILHIITSAVTGFVGFLTASQVGAALPNSSSEFGFDVISAAVLGGVSIAGGKGSPLYSVLGVLILAILDNGLIILNISTYWQLVVSGLILLFAVTLDSVKNMQAAKKY